MKNSTCSWFCWSGSHMDIWTDFLVLNFEFPLQVTQSREGCMQHKENIICTLLFPYLTKSIHIDTEHSTSLFHRIHVGFFASPFIIIQFMHIFQSFNWLVCTTWPKIDLPFQSFRKISTIHRRIVLLSVASFLFY